MSFMFNPHPYDDMTPVNRPDIDFSVSEKSTFGYKNMIQSLFEFFSKPEVTVAAIDGVPTVEFSRYITSLGQLFSKAGIPILFFDISSVYKTSESLEQLFAENLPTDRKKDPILLYGKLYKGNYKTVFDENEFNSLQQTIAAKKKNGEKVIIYGQGAASELLWDVIDKVIYVDVTPKEIMLRTIAGKYKNLGDSEIRSLKLIQRRIYYVDLELAVHLRKSLIENNKMDYYIISDKDESSALFSFNSFSTILDSLANRPFRCKPVYIEGVWGGHYIRNTRKFPDFFKNIAWVFDLIPLEVSILVEVGSHIIDIPYYTFVQIKGEKIMGKEITKRFGGYFPVRFNYDDTFHSSGNMSIQCHPAKDFCMSEFGEHGGQDEGYYIVATGHDAKTYCGFKNGADTKKFIAEIKKSEEEKTAIAYDEYINAVESVPGKQFLLPGGTIHASGRNQVILEIGSLSVGSYTFKLYDYLRKDLDGTLRPIHSHYGEKVLELERDADFVSKRLNIEPRLLEKGSTWEEWLVGEDALVYYSCRQLKFDKIAQGDTAGEFHVIALVDGEQAVVRSLENKSLSYTLNFLDIVVIPASVGKYEIVNMGNQPIIVYKVKVK